MAPSFLAVALRPEIVRRAAGTSAVVGTVLAAINHGPELLGLQVGARRALQIGLTYLVPYCVSTYAASMQELRHRSAGRPAPREAPGPLVAERGRRAPEPPDRGEGGRGAARAAEPSGVTP